MDYSALPLVTHPPAINRSSNPDPEERRYPSCLLQGSSSSPSVPCFMTASSPVPFSEIMAADLIPDIMPEVEGTSVSRTKNKMKKDVVRTGKFRCRRCKKRFQTKGGLNLHLREHQPEIYLMKCPDCQFFTYQKANFVKHAAVKHRKDINGVRISESISCPHNPSCAFKCFTEEQMKIHLARKHMPKEGKPFKCDECEYSTIEKAALEKHQGIVHKRERDYDCSICGFRSQTTSGLARHHRSHSEVKPHHCHLCPMTYADKKRLREHLLKHSNVKQFTCPNCQYATNRKDNLKLHIKRNHMPS